MNKVFIVEVGLMRSFLEQNDVLSELRNHHTSTLLGEVPFTSVWPELWVIEEQSVKALELISQLKQREASGPDWTCQRCSETNPVNFDICWQCGGSGLDN